MKDIQDFFGSVWQIVAKQQEEAAIAQEEFYKRRHAERMKENEKLRPIININVVVSPDGNIKETSIEPFDVNDK